MGYNPLLIRVWREEMLLRAVTYVCLAEDLRKGDRLSLGKTPPHKKPGHCYRQQAGSRTKVVLVVASIKPSKPKRPAANQGCSSEIDCIRGALAKHVVRRQAASFSGNGIRSAAKEQATRHNTE
jgi:hypothetical protein